MLTILLTTLIAAATPPRDILIVSDRSASMFNYNRNELYIDILEQSKTWGNNYHVTVISCDPTEAPRPYLDQADFSLQTLHRELVSLTGFRDDCLTAVNVWMDNENNFRNTPLTILAYSDPPRSVWVNIDFTH